MSYNYPTLRDVTNKIHDKKKDKLYYRYQQLTAKNPFVPFLNMDINIEDLNALKMYVKKLLDTQMKPFNFSKYTTLKSLLFMRLVNPNLTEKDAQDT